MRGPVLAQTYKDAGTPATEHPAALPQALIEAALEAVKKIKFDEALTQRFLGQWLTEPPANAYFDEGDETTDLSQGMPRTGRLVLDRCSRLMYHNRQLFINGEVAAVPASAPLQKLADTRELLGSDPLAQKLKPRERQMLNDWLQAGWIHYA